MAVNYISSGKVRNAFSKFEDSDKYSMKFRDISINGIKKGCSGHITNLDNDVCVYINTEQTSMGLGMLYRYAERQDEWTGGLNHFAHSLDEIVKQVRNMLEDPQKAEIELAHWGKHYQGKVPVQRYGKDGLDKHGNRKAKEAER